MVHFQAEKMNGLFKGDPQANAKQGLVPRLRLLSPVILSAVKSLLCPPYLADDPCNDHLVRSMQYVVTTTSLCSNKADFLVVKGHD